MKTNIRSAIACMAVATLAGMAHAAAPSPNLLIKLLESAEANNPDIKAARNQLQASDRDIDAAKWKLWPSVSLVSESNTAQSQSASVRSNSMRLEQTLYDFGKVRSQISEYQSARQSSSAQLDSKVLDIKLQIVNLWQSLFVGVRKKEISDRQIQQLANYDQQINNRITKGATPIIERELTTSRLLQAGIERKSVISGIDNALLKLQALTGMSSLKAEISPEKMLIRSHDPLLRFMPPQGLEDLVSLHPAVMKAENDKTVLSHRLRSMQSDQLPQLYMRVDKPLQPTSVYPNTSPSVYTGLRFSLDGGLSGLESLQAMSSRLQAAEEAVESSRLDVRQAVESDISELNANKAKIGDATQAIKSSIDVLRSYERQFQAGRKSWQDLLNALRELTQNEFALAETEAAGFAAMYRIQLRSGQRLSEVQ